jgi:LmbE family N-acetylglucosaminyl deacetylase
MPLFSKSDRILFVAPHPDDESLGGGGLLQRAFSAGVAVRVLFATNGDNNPWAQRFWERRWQIGPSERARWGRRRREEALAAIASLGGSPECARFLNFGDQRITSLLMQSAPEFFAAFADEIRAFDPSVIVIPTILDAHPDHSALCVALTIVIDSMENSELRVWEYLIHRPRIGVFRRPIILRLTPVEIEGKKQAIECHKTQVALCATRFLRFAGSEEAYYAHAAVGVASEARPVSKAQICEDGLNLVVRALKRERLGSQILLAFRSEGSQMHRWQIRVPIFSGMAEVRDLVSGERLPDAVAAWNHSNLTVVVPIAQPSGVDAFFVKVSSRTLFFDRSGWFQVPISGVGSAERKLKVPNLSRLL